ncbi:hypothetical protein PYCC9005_002410 [Savitreella phatthalungensis]
MPKASAAPKFYAVARGRSTGIFTAWSTVQPLVHGYSGAKYASFKTRAEATNFLTNPTYTGRSVESRANPASLRGTASSGRSAGLLGGKVLTDQDLPSRCDQDTTIIWTDGSSLSNGKYGARAGYGCYFQPNPDLGHSLIIESNASFLLQAVSARLLDEDRQTNQRAELRAIITALDRACMIDSERRDSGRHHKVYITTDSMYSINALTDWSARWKLNGWKTSTGQPVENADLVKRALALIDSRKRTTGCENGAVYFVKVRAHSGVRANEEVDALAKAGAQKAMPQRYEDDDIERMEELMERNRNAY